MDKQAETNENLLVFNITERGSSHVCTESPGQDYSVSRVLRDSNGTYWVLAIVADGVGSCVNSQDGSRVAVTAAESYIVETMEADLPDLASEETVEEKPAPEDIAAEDKTAEESVAEEMTAEETVAEEMTAEETVTEGVSQMSVPDILREAFKRAEDAVLDEAFDKGMPPITYDTTLTAALYDGKTVYYGHIGDGGIVALYSDGTYELITPRLKGEEASSVIPLRMEDSWVFAKTNQEVVSFAMMTDGLLDRNVGTIALNNRVYFPFFSFALSARAETPGDVETFVEYYRSRYINNDEYRIKVTDDMSFVAAQNIAAVKALPPVIFDKDKWNAESAAYEKKVAIYLRQQAIIRAKKQNGDYSENESETESVTDSVTENILREFPETS